MLNTLGNRGIEHACEYNSLIFSSGKIPTMLNTHINEGIEHTCERNRKLQAPGPARFAKATGAAISLLGFVRGKP